MRYIYDIRFYKTDGIAHTGPFRRSIRKWRVNKPCPCGSGKKFKKCCQ